MEKLANHILVAYDGSELSKKALKYAESIAKADDNTQLHILSVKPITIYPFIYTSTVYDEMEDEILRNTKTNLDEAKASLNLTNQVVARIETGPPAETIVDYANQNDIDLIVMGSRGLGSMKEFFLGSVSHHVVQTAKCPVFVIK